MKLYDRKMSRGITLILAIVMIASLAVVTGCGKSSNGGGSGEPEEETLETENAYVAGKCFCLCGMKTIDDEYDAALIKDMFGIKSVGRYMQIYFQKGGKAYVAAKVYGKEIVEGTWGENKEGVTILELPDETYEFTKEDNGELNTVKTEEDGDEFFLTFHVPKETPDTLVEYVNQDAEA